METIGMTDEMRDRTEIEKKKRYKRMKREEIAKARAESTSTAA